MNVMASSKLPFQDLFFATPPSTSTPRIGYWGSNLLSHRLPLCSIFHPTETIATRHIYTFRQFASHHREVMLVEQNPCRLNAVSGLLVSADSEWKDGYEDA
jgi:hypothetical protein